MKPLILFLLLVLTIRSIAQQRQPIVKDTLPAKSRFGNTVEAKKAVISATEAEIEKELSSILAAYRTKPNTQANWSKIKREAQDMLYRYFKNGKLMGTKAEEAYFVKMGAESMTATDIANHKMVLVAGIAPIKAAEFTILRIEMLNAIN